MNASPLPFKSIRRRAFTLIELLVATAILTLMMIMFLTIINNLSSTVTRSSARLDAYASGRTGFDIMGDKLSRATLNTYWDYYNSSGVRRNTSSTGGNYTTFIPATYGRASDLQFLVQQNTNQTATQGYYGQEVYFALPLASSTTAPSTTNPGYQSTQGLLNACGYFVQYGSNTSYYPTLFKNYSNYLTYRYRLYEAVEPTEQFQYYMTPGSTSVTGTIPAWVFPILNNASDAANTPNTQYARPLANNVIALIVWPQDPNDPTTSGTELATVTPGGYAYDSQYPYDTQNYTPPSPFTASSFPITFCQEPPTVQVTMVLIDEASARRYCTGATPPPVIENALQGKFVQETNYQTDLYGGGSPSAVTGTLGLINYLQVTQHINCQVLNTKIALRESKWSK